MSTGRIERPFRFSTGAAAVADPERLRRAARRIESLGYDTFVVPDHFMIPLAPLVALQAVADATTTLRLGQLMLAQGFRHPAVLAKELATLDVLSGGRVEVGIGAGWMAEEFEQAGMGFDAASTRIAQLEETVTILKGLFADGPFTFEGDHFRVHGLDGTPEPVQRPHPPVLTGGRGPKLLAAAGRCADIVQILPDQRRAGGQQSGGQQSGGQQADGRPSASTITPAAFDEKISLVREAAGDRFADIELSVLLQYVVVTDDPAPAADAFLARFADEPAGPTREEVLASPVVAIGSVGEVCDKLRVVRERFGFTYFGAPFDARPELLEPVLTELAGT